MNKRLWAIGAAGALTLAGLVPVAQAAAAPSAPTSTTVLTAAERAASSLPAPKPIVWGECASEGLNEAGAECGYLTVPLDWDKPRGKTIQIAVSRILHTVPDSEYQGVMLTNPGGPGGSGLSLVVLNQYVPNDAGYAYDWIGFDPRGVGESIPALSCIPTYAAGPKPLYDPVTPGLEKVWLKRSKAYADACRSGGALLDHIKTVDVAKDMDYLRVALGQKQINYYGFSYGTYLAQVYSTLFPSKVRRMVLDATVDPRGVWYKNNLDQDVAFEKTMDAFFGWVAKNDASYHLGKSTRAVKALWYKEKYKLLKHPAGGVVGPDEWTDIFLNAGYYQVVWPEIGDLFASWVNGKDLDKLTTAYEDYIGPDDDNGFAVYNAVQCTDVAWPKSWSTWKRDNWRTFVKAPFLTWDNAWFNAPCLFWPAKSGTPVKIDGKKTASVLMISETLDAATPYSGSVYVRSLYPGARLIAEPGGTTHAGTLYGNACVDDQIAAYLLDGTLPKRKPGNQADSICAPLPEPEPYEASATVAGTGSSRGGAAALKLRSSATALG